MKPHEATFVLGFILIVFSLWGYFSADSPSYTALIPAAAGVLLIAFTAGLRKESKTISHLAVGVTILVLLALVMPLRSAIQREDGEAIFRVIVMMVMALVTVIIYIKSFVDARKRQK
jgi:uncharacterized membrane protein (UPF0136 family)